MTIPNAVGEWSIQDIVAHLTAWEQNALALLLAAQRGGEPVYPVWNADMSMDETNAWIFNANHNRTLADVLAESRRVQEQFVRQLETLSEEDLNDPNRFKWLNGNSLADSIAGDSYEHYHDHANMIREWLGLEKVQ
jgi:hypothetical protein